MNTFLSKDQAEGIRFVLEEVYGAKKQQSKQFIKNCEKLFA
jgi:hypothetical protein